MTLRLPALAFVSLMLVACAKEPANTDGNGPGNADGVGGREDPPVVTQPGIPPGGPTAAQPTDSASAPAETPPPRE
jgi:hypothetical protein